MEKKERFFELAVSMPRFPGFYPDTEMFYDESESMVCSLFDADRDLYDSLNEEEFRELYTAADEGIDMGASMEETAKKVYHEVYAPLLSKHFKKHRYGHVKSPKEYNFLNDELIVIVSTSSGELNKLMGIAMAREAEDHPFRKFLKENYASHSGFVSFVAETPSEFFAEMLLNMESDEKDTHIYESDMLRLGRDTAILFEFIVSEDMPEIEMTYYATAVWKEGFDIAEEAEKIKGGL